jgi:hypothetical protein
LIQRLVVVKVDAIFAQTYKREEALEHLQNLGYTKEKPHREKVRALNRNTIS